MTDISRRTVAAGMVWSVPCVVAAAAVPAFAVSGASTVSLMMRTANLSQFDDRSGERWLRYQLYWEGASTNFPVPASTWLLQAYQYIGTNEAGKTADAPTLPVSDVNKPLTSEELTGGTCARNASTAGLAHLAPRRRNQHCARGGSGQRPWLQLLAALDR